MDPICSHCSNGDGQIRAATLGPGRVQGRAPFRFLPVGCMKNPEDSRRALRASRPQADLVKGRRASDSRTLSVLDNLRTRT